MADFTATDNVEEIVLQANSPAGIAWALEHAGSALHLGSPVATFSAAPGYVLHVYIPLIRAAGLTVDGDLVVVTS